MQPNTLYRLVAKDIHHSFAGPNGEVKTLDGVSLQLTDQTFTCLIGPSGCGKSTLLRVLAGLVPPHEGDVLLNGKPLNSPQRQIGFAFQDSTLMPWRTVEDNLMLPLELAGLPRHERRECADHWLSLLGLSDFRDNYPAALSGGMAQRLAIGRALIHGPEVLLMDEPFGALDALTREQVSEELLRIWAGERKTVLMVTHSIQEAILLADRVLVMSSRPGRLLSDFAIDLPRPRRLTMVTAPNFVQLEAEVRAALRLN